MERKTRKTLSVNRPVKQPVKTTDVRGDWIHEFGSTRAKATVAHDYPELRVYREERARKTLEELGAQTWFGRSAELKAKPRKKSSPSQAALNFLSGFLAALSEREKSEGSEDAPPAELTIIYIDSASELSGLFSHLGARAEQPDACFDPVLDEEAWQAGEALLVTDLFPDAEAIVLPVPKFFPNIADPRQAASD